MAITADIAATLHRAAEVTVEALGAERADLLEFVAGAPYANRQPIPGEFPAPVLESLQAGLRDRREVRASWTPDLSRRLGRWLSGAALTLAVPVFLRDRGLGWWCVHGEERPFADGELAFARTVATIVASALERDRVAALLRDREAQLEGILNSLQDVVWAADGSGTETVFMSAASAQVYGRPAEAFYADSGLWLSIVHPDDRERVYVVNNQLPIVGSFDIEYRIVRPDGGVRWLHDRARVIRNEQGAPVRIDGIATDITVRKRAELEAMARKRQYRTLVSNLPDELVVLFDEHLNIGLAGGTLLERLGLTHDEVEGRRFPEVPLALVRNMVPLAARAIEGEPQQEEITQRGMHLSVQAIPLLNGEGHSQGGMVLVKDVSQQRLAQRLHGEHQRELLEVFESITDAFITVDASGRITRLNARAADWIGVPREAALGERLEELCPELLPAEGLAAAGSFDGHLQRGDRWFSARVHPNDAGYALYAIDTSERRRSDRAIVALNAQLAQRLRRLRALHEIDRVLTGSHDLQLTLETILERAQRHLGADAMAVFEHNPALARLEHTASLGFLQPDARAVTLAMGAWPAGQVALQQSPLSLASMRDAFGEGAAHPLLDVEGFVSYNAVPLVSKGQLMGVLEVFHRREFVPDQEWQDFLATLGGQMGLAIVNARLLRDVQLTNAQLTLAVDQIIEASARAIDFHEGRTEGHSRRCMEWAVRVGRAFGMLDPEIGHLRRGALLHDLGMLGVPDAVRFKPGPLEDHEWGIVRNHPRFALELLQGVRLLRPATEIPHAHHERWDGTGYPRGLRGEAIPLEARIFAVVDAFESMRSDRADRPGLSLQEATAELRAGSGSRFDPSVVEVFMDMLQQG